MSIKLHCFLSRHCNSVELGVKEDMLELLVQGKTFVSMFKLIQIQP